jgi:replicative DNA helicase
MEQQLLKLLLNKDFFTANRDRTTPTMFPGELKTLFDTIVEAHKKYERTVTLNEVAALHKTQHPTLTRAQRDNIAELLLDIEQLDTVGPDVAQDVLRHMWRIETFREIADIAVNGMDGKEPDLEKIRGIVEKRSATFIPEETYTVVPSELDEIFDALDQRARWRFNVPALANHLPGMSGGELLIVFARPELGKSAFHVSLACAPGGFCSQGAKVHAITNEEPGVRTKARAASAATQMTAQEIVADRSRAKLLWAGTKDNYTIADGVGMTMGALDAYCRRNKPDVLIVDQLDKLGVNGSFAATHEKLREIYVQAREIAKRHNLLMIAISQASADAEEKAYISYSQMEGSKTGKAAEADVIMGIGRYPANPGVEEDFTRIVTISKNKISGYHGSVTMLLDAPLSTYRD